MYESLILVLGSIEEQRDQVASILSSNAPPDPKVVLNQVFRCAMGTKPHALTTINDSLFCEFALLSGYANGTPIPSSHTRSDSAKRSTRLGLDEVQEIFDVCVRSQGALNDHSFCLAIAHLHLMRTLLDEGRRPDPGSTSVMTVLNEAADRLNVVYVKPRIQAFPFPSKYYDECSCVVKTLWRYSEGLEMLFRRYATTERRTTRRKSSSSTAAAAAPAHADQQEEESIVNGHSFTKCMTDLGIIPQLSAQVVERLYEQSKQRMNSPDGATRRASTSTQTKPGLTMDWFLECIARVAATLYADDTFSKRVTLESKVDHMISTVFVSAFPQMFGMPFPIEQDELPQPVIEQVIPATISSSITSVVLEGELFGALGRGVWIATSLSPDIVHITDEVEAHQCVVPIRLSQNVVWDACTVSVSNAKLDWFTRGITSRSVSPTDTDPSVASTSIILATYDVTFTHNILIAAGNTYEDTFFRVPLHSDVAQYVYRLSFPLVKSLGDEIATVFLDACAQVAYNRDYLYESCWEYVCANYCIGRGLFHEVPAALGLSNATVGEGKSPATSVILQSMYATYSTVKESDGTVQARSAMSRASFCQVLVRLAVASGVTADRMEDTVRAMLKPATFASFDPARRRSTLAGGIESNTNTSSRRGSLFGRDERTDLDNERDEDRQSELEGRRRSLRDNDAMLRTVAAEQRNLKIIKSNLAEIKGKLSDSERAVRNWEAVGMDVRECVDQLKGILELVLPANIRGMHEVPAKLGAMYRSRLLEICERVLKSVHTGESKEGNADAQSLALSMKQLLQQQLDELRRLSQAQSPPPPLAHKASTPDMTANHGSSLNHTTTTLHLTTRLQELQAEKEALDTLVAQQKSQLEDRQAYATKCKAEKDDLAAQLHVARGSALQQRATFEVELQKLRESSSSLHEKLKVAATDRAKLERSYHQLETVVVAKKNEISRLEELKKAEEEAVARLVAAAQISANQNHGEESKSLTSPVAVIEQLEKLRSAEKGQYEQQILELQGTVSDTEKRRDLLQQEVEDLTARKNKFQRHCETLRNVLDDMTKAASSAGFDLSALLEGSSRTDDDRSDDGDVESSERNKKNQTNEQLVQQLRNSLLALQEVKQTLQQDLEAEEEQRARMAARMDSLTPPLNRQSESPQLPTSHRGKRKQSTTEFSRARRASRSPDQHNNVRSGAGVGRVSPPNDPPEQQRRKSSVASTSSTRNNSAFSLPSVRYQGTPSAAAPPRRGSVRNAGIAVQNVPSPRGDGGGASSSAALTTDVAPPMTTTPRLPLVGDSGRGPLSEEPVEPARQWSAAISSASVYQFGADDQHHQRRSSASSARRRSINSGEYRSSGPHASSDETESRFSHVGPYRKQSTDGDADSTDMKEFVHLPRTAPSSSSSRPNTGLRQCASCRSLRHTMRTQIQLMMRGVEFLQGELDTLRKLVGNDLRSAFVAMEEQQRQIITEVARQVDAAAVHEIPSPLLIGDAVAVPTSSSHTQKLTEEHEAPLLPLPPAPPGSSAQTKWLAEVAKQGPVAPLSCGMTHPRPPSPSKPSSKAKSLQQLDEHTARRRELEQEQRKRHRGETLAIKGETLISVSETLSVEREDVTTAPEGMMMIASSKPAVMDDGPDWATPSHWLRTTTRIPVRQKSEHHAMDSGDLFPEGAAHDLHVGSGAHKPTGRHAAGGRIAGRGSFAAFLKRIGVEQEGERPAPPPTVGIEAMLGQDLIKYQVLLRNPETGDVIAIDRATYEATSGSPSVGEDAKRVATGQRKKALLERGDWHRQDDEAEGATPHPITTQFEKMLQSVVADMAHRASMGRTPSMLTPVAPSTAGSGRRPLKASTASAELGSTLPSRLWQPSTEGGSYPVEKARSVVSASYKVSMAKMSAVRQQAGQPK